MIDRDQADRIGVRLEALYSAIIYDVLRARGIEGRVLAGDIHSLTPGMRLGGVVFTAEGGLDSDVDDHHSLLAWTELLSEVPAGTVAVLAANDARFAHMGELSAETLEFRGVRGFVTDGGTRDARFIIDEGFPLWCSYRTPVDMVGRWTVHSLGEPITIGGVEVATGDWLLADDDGVIVVAADMAESVIAEAEIMAGTEDQIRAAILNGMSPRDAYLRYGKF